MNSEDEQPIPPPSDAIARDLTPYSVTRLVPAGADDRIETRDKEWIGTAPVAPVRIRGRWSYIVEQRLGTGGCGSVYAATCEANPSLLADCPPSRVAVKYFKPPLGQDPLVLLKRELSAMLAIRHSRIPRLYDWSLEPPSPFVVLEYFANGSLQDHIMDRGRISVEEAWRLLADLLAALTEAHRACILHLDVKPGNVLLDGKGGFVLTDFGIAQGHLVSRGIIDTGLGAPLYQSPEQRRDDHDSFDARTDLWGVGMTVWAALTGVHVIDMRNHRLTGAKDRTGMRRLSELVLGVPSRLEQIVMSMLATEQADRPASAAEALAMVEAMMGGHAVAAGSVPEVRPADPDDARRVAESLMDPLWASLCKSKDLQACFVRFEAGEALCREGDSSYHAFVLLKGRLRIEKHGKVLAVEDREGTFVGELTTLVGRTRTATVWAEEPTWVCVFKASEMERFVTQNPAVGIRLLKSLADRLCRVLGD